MSTPLSLQSLGWHPFFSRQLTLEELEVLVPARITSVHRSRVDAVSEHGSLDLVVPRDVQRAGIAETLTAGDWVLVDRLTLRRMIRRLDRRTAVVRMSAGRQPRAQAVAANVDTLFIVSSCNHDFNPSRLERYITLALEAAVEPVIVLTKADLCADPSGFVDRARASAPRAEVLALDATQPTATEQLRHWLGAGRTLAFVGSSGVGKSTLVNALLGIDRQATAAIREDDSRGRHTTSARQLFRIASGAWVLDTPGMRELRIGAADEGVESAFEDLAALAERCRFRDCLHDGDEGCALLAALAEGLIDRRRFTSYLKLRRESEHAARTLHERRENEKRKGKLYKAVLARRRKERGEGTR